MVVLAQPLRVPQAYEELEIDSDVGDLAEDFDQAQQFRAETLDFVRLTLGLVDSERVPEVTNQVIQSFDMIGHALREQMSYCK